MARNYRRSTSRRSRSTGRSLVWVWILMGVLVGVLGTVGGYTWLAESSTKARPVAHKGRLPEKLAKNKKSEQQPPPRYEFYTLLPGMEIQLPDSPIASAATAPKVAAASNPAPKVVQSTSVSSKPSQKVETSPASKVSNTTKLASASPTTASTTVKPPKTPVKPSSKTSDTNTIKAPDSSRVLSKRNIPCTTLPKPQLLPQTTTLFKPQTVNTAQYIIQAGIFKDFKQADEFKTRLTRQGFTTKIQQIKTPEGRAWFRVTLGPFISEPSALRQKKRLEDNKVRGLLILQRPTVAQKKEAPRT